MRNKGENLCPVCGQSTYFPYTKHEHIPNSYRCNNCGFCYEPLKDKSEEEKTYFYVEELIDKRSKLDNVLKSYFQQIEGFDTLRKKFNEKMFLGFFNDR